MLPPLNLLCIEYVLSVYLSLFMQALFEYLFHHENNVRNVSLYKPKVDLMH